MASYWAALPPALLVLWLAQGLTPAPALAADAPVPSAKLTQPPKLLQFVEATWPADATPTTQPVVVLLQLDLDATGAVAKAEVVQSAGPLFDRAARDAALQMRFQPAQWDGVPGPVRILYRYRLVWRAPLRAVLAGQVRDGDRGKPVAGHRLEAVGLAGAVTLTRADGRFELRDLPGGTLRIRLTGKPFQEVEVAEVLTVGMRTEVRYTVSRQTVAAQAEDDYEIEAKAPPLRRDPVAIRVDAAQAMRIPGAQGDVLKVVDSLGGVGRAAVGSSDVVVWGSAPGESRTYVDGVPIPRLYHQGGLRSVIHPDLVAGLELLPGGYGPSWGRSLGAVVAAQSKRVADLLGPRDSTGQRPWSASLAVDPLEGGARVAGEWAGMAVAAAGRMSWLQELAGGFIDPTVQELLPLPKYRDGQVRLALQDDPGQRLDLSWLHSRDESTRVVARADPSQAISDTKRDGFDRLILRGQRTLPAAAEANWALWLGRDQAMQQAQVGLLGTAQDRETWRGGVRADWRKALSLQLDLLAGIDLEVEHATEQRTGSIGAPPREGDLKVFGQLPPERLASDRWSTLFAGAAPWVAAALKLADEKLVVEPGLRLDPQVRSVSRRTPLAGNTPEIGLFSMDFSVEPRLQVRSQLSEGVKARAAWAKVQQPSAAGDLSSVFGNPALLAAPGEHAVVAAEVTLPVGLTLEVAAFHLQAEQLGVRSPYEQPLLAQALVSTGESRSTGLQVSAKAQPSARWLAWFTWTWSQAERRNSAKDSWRLSDYDQPHLLTAALAWQPAEGWDLGLRLRLASGTPRTPVVGAWYDALRDQWQPLYGSLNSERLPLFVQADVRAARRWQGKRAWAEAYVEVQNATYHQNAEDYVYSGDFAWRDVLRGLPILPLAGLKCGF